MRAPPVPLTFLVPLLLACGGDGVAPSTERELHDRLVFETGDGIGVMAPDGSERGVVPIGDDLDRALDAELSPDGRRVVFVGSRDGMLDLYVMNADGSEREQVTSDSAEDLSPTWTPDADPSPLRSGRDRSPRPAGADAHGRGRQRTEAASGGRVRRGLVAGRSPGRVHRVGHAAGDLRHGSRRQQPEEPGRGVRGSVRGRQGATVVA